MKIKVYRLNFCKACLVALFTMGTTGLFALDQAPAGTSQTSQTVKVTGTVKDASGNPVVGATIIEKGTTNAVATNAQGVYTINTKPGATLQVQHISYSHRDVQVNNRPSIDFVVEGSTEDIEEVVVVGYGVQKKATVTGAISQLKGDEVVTTKNENTVNMLAGKIPGLRVVQNSSEPGKFGSTIDLRGFGSPLVVIDGVVRTNIQRLDADDIEDISVLKDASAAIYGLNSTAGVILITTKKGTKGKSEITYNGTMTWQRPSDFPDMVNAADWMTLYNEKEMHSVMNNPSRTYSAEEIDNWRNGTYTSTNWKEEVFRNSAPQMQHTFNASGGNEAVTYYASFGYNGQSSFLQTDAINYEKYSIRSNISANINKNLKFDLNLSGFIDDKKQTPHGSYDIVRATWIMRPMDAVWYNEEEGMYQTPQNNTIINPVAAMDPDVAGESSYKSKWFQSNAALTYTVPQVKGLSLKGFYSYDAIINDNKEFVKSYTLYGSDFATSGKTTTWNTRNNKPYQTSRYYYSKANTMWNISANYKRTFGGVHNVSALALYEDTYKDGDNFRGSKESMLPVSEIFAGDPDNQTFTQDDGKSALYEMSNHSWVGRLTYDYANKYMIEGTIRHEASSKFYKDWKWATTPSIMVGYRISEERFWKNSPLSFINNFKIRGSYGVIPNDGSLYYEWMTGYYYPANSGGTGSLPKGYIFYDGTTQKYIASSNDKGLANTNLTWYDTAMTNIGFDAEAWHGLLGVTVEFFNRKNTGMPKQRLAQVPGITGVPIPYENLESNRQRGFEVELTHRNTIGELRYNVKANMSYTKERDLYRVQTPAGNSYTNWRSTVKNRDTGMWWGYGTRGRVTSWDQIYYNPVFIGSNTVMGDYLYQDWNGDGYISELDLHPLVNNSKIPLLNYAVNLSAEWKGFDLSMLIQGTSSRYTSYSEILLTPLTWGNAGTLQQFMNRWHPVDPTASPYDPATEWKSGHYGYTGSQPNTDSKFNMQNAAYIRLKSMEIGYTLPKKWMDAVNMKSVRVFVNGYNMLTFTKMKYVDPEFPSDSYGYNYPLNKTYSVGLNVKF